MINDDSTHVVWVKIRKELCNTRSRYEKKPWFHLKAPNMFLMVLSMKYHGHCNTTYQLATV